MIHNDAQTTLRIPPATNGPLFDKQSAQYLWRRIFILSMIARCVDLDKNLDKIKSDNLNECIFGSLDADDETAKKKEGENTNGDNEDGDNKDEETNDKENTNAEGSKSDSKTGLSKSQSLLRRAGRLGGKAGGGDSKAPTLMVSRAPIIIKKKEVKKTISGAICKMLLGFYELYDDTINPVVLTSLSEMN
jgi:hypothetical protein